MKLLFYNNQYLYNYYFDALILESEARIEGYKDVICDIMNSNRETPSTKAQPSTRTHDSSKGQSSTSAHSSTTDHQKQNPYQVENCKTSTLGQQLENTSHNITDGEIRIPLNYLAQAMPLINLLANNISYFN